MLATKTLGSGIVINTSHLMHFVAARYCLMLLLLLLSSSVSLLLASRN